MFLLLVCFCCCWRVFGVVVVVGVDLVVVVVGLVFVGVFSVVLVVGVMMVVIVSVLLLVCL